MRFKPLFLHCPVSPSIGLRFDRLKNTLRKGSLWNPGYFAETIGSVTEAIIKQYIAKQNNE